MKILIALLTTGLIATQAHAQRLRCTGVRQATVNCPTQPIALNLDTYQPGEFELRTRVPANTSKRTCYDLSSGHYQNDGTLLANRQVDFLPNYGGIFLDKPKVVGRFYYIGTTMFLTDNLTGQYIELSCR